ncbi:MAG: lytic murein transglycosylase [Candidatus Cloacimonetes bacterium]|nr:lytic murein transglycosylase [Candidatus Cloacimonadota bacterium]
MRQNLKKIVMLVLLSSLSYVILVADTETTAENKIEQKISELKERLRQDEIPSDWFENNLNHEKFKIYHQIEKYFKEMPERKVADKKRDFEWYKKYFDVENRISKGLSFIEENKNTLELLEKKNGIHYELIVAILALESNFGSSEQRGNFYIFNTLVSQYALVPKREKFAYNQLKSLYKFSNKIKKDTFYFIGSYAGASGWAQFIPSSQISYFISFDGIAENTDIYSIEDNLASIENYLNAHRLNRNTINDSQKRYDAVYAYNHSKHYVKAVLIIYDGLREARKNSN